MKTTTQDPPPVALAELKWREPSLDQLWQDGTQILAAVRMRDSRWNRECWEYSVVTIHADEGRFDLECNNEPWGWDYDSIHYFVVLSGKIIEDQPEP